MDRSGFRYTFGPYTVDAATRRLLHRHTPIPLNGKAFELLLLFAQSGGAALSREQLYHALWPGEAVEDGNLTQNVYLLRRALEGGEYIQTIPRFGYRFRVPVHTIEPAAPRAFAPLRAASIVLAAVLLALSGSTAGREHPALPAAAQESYALGTFHLHLRTIADLDFARTYFQQTVRLAPEHPEGYAAVASVDALLAEYYADGSRDQRRELEAARQYDALALARDPESSDALATSGFIAYRFDQNADAAERYLRAAIASNPDNAAAHHWYGVLLLVEGDVPGAVAQLQSAHRLEPASEIFTRWLARAYAYAGRPGDALAMVNEALRIEPHDEASLLVRAIALEERGDLTGALKTLHVLARDPWEHQFTVPDEARIEAMLHPQKRRGLIARVDKAIAHGTVDPFEASLFYTAVGLPERARALLTAFHPSLVTAGLERDDPRQAQRDTN